MIPGPSVEDPSIMAGYLQSTWVFLIPYVKNVISYWNLRGSLDLWTGVFCFNSLCLCQ